jgi:hypothetical protein
LVQITSRTFGFMGDLVIDQLRTGEINIV